MRCWHLYACKQSFHELVEMPQSPHFGKTMELPRPEEMQPAVAGHGLGPWMTRARPSPEPPLHCMQPRSRGLLKGRHGVTRPRSLGLTRCSPTGTQCSARSVNKLALFSLRSWASTVAKGKPNSLHFVDCRVNSHPRTTAFQLPSRRERGREEIIAVASAQQPMVSGMSASGSVVV